jgi:Ca2+-binding RTX toxin-like protein
MRRIRSESAVNELQPLEARRLLSVSAFTPERVIPGTGGPPFAMAVADNGSFMIANGAFQKLVVTRFAASGRQLGKQLALGALAQTFEQSVAVSMDPDGDAVVAYNAPGGSLQLRLISRTGQVSKAIEFAHATTSQTLGRPSVSMAPKGDFYVGWSFVDSHSNPDPRDLTAVLVRHYNATGAPVAKPVVVARDPDSTVNSLGNIHLSALPDASGVMCAYEDANDPNVSVDATFVSTSGIVTGLHVVSDVNLNTFTAQSQSSYLFGIDNVRLPTREARAQLGESPPIRLGSTTEGSDQFSQASSTDFLPDGGFVAVYEKRADLSDPNSNVVLALQYDKTGKQLGKPVELGRGAQPNTQNIYTAVGADASGSIVAAWMDPADGSVRYRRLATQDFAFTRGSELYLLGTPENEVLSVTKSGDKIIATRSRTSRTFDASKISALTINAYGENDTIINETGLRASIQGGDGSDIITSAASVSLQIEGGVGNDHITVADNAAAHIFGGKGNDSLEGGAGKQFLDGQSGNDTILGGDGNDRITGGEGDDRLIGGAGDDIINAGLGKDYVDAGKGDDIINAKDGETDMLFGSVGTDAALVDKGLDVLDGVENVS